MNGAPATSLLKEAVKGSVVFGRASERENKREGMNGSNDGLILGLG